MTDAGDGGRDERRFAASPDPGAAHGTVATPIGALLVRARAEGVTGVWFEGRWTAADLAGGPPDAEAVRMLAWARGELDAYFAGTLRQFTVPCALGGTAFQARVWQALRRVPFGEVVSYRTIAASIGAGAAMRAVGAANGRNPVPVIVPCHRVIGADGSLTGFGGGLSRKRWLLEHEGALPASLVGPA